MANSPSPEQLAQLASLDAPSGIRDLSPLPVPAVFSKQAWRDTYFHLKNAATTAALASVDDVDAIAAKYQNAGIIPIAIGRYRSDAPNAGATALEERRTFFAGALTRKEFDLFFPVTAARHYGLNTLFTIPSELFLTNDGAAPQSVTADFDDGKGPREVKLDTHVPVDYPSAGTKTITVTADGLQSKFALDVNPSSAPTPNETWGPGSLVSPLSHNGVTATGHAWVYYGKGNTQITNPMIISEGFPGGYSLDYLWSVLNEQNLATNVLAQGKDLIILGYDDGTTYVEANAGVAIAAIQRAQKEQSGTAAMVVGGASMGGLITRFALAEMEMKGMPQNTRLYFSFDSPHRGANLPLGVQYFCNIFQGHSDFVKQAEEKIQSLAAQEMMNVYLPAYNQAVQTPAPLATTFWANLKAVGNYPSTPILAGVSNGSLTGASNGTPAGADAVSFSGWSAAADVYVAPGAPSTAEISYARIVAWTNTSYFPSGSPLANSPQLDSSPGGYSNFFDVLYQGLQQAGYSPVENAQNGTFIPIASALAMDSLSLYDQNTLFPNLQNNPPASHLQHWYADTSNNTHVTVTPGIATFLLTILSQQVEATTAAHAAVQAQV